MGNFRILGGGVAGLTAALRMARANHTVDVFDIHDDCGARFSGDFQGLDNFGSPPDALDELRDIGIDVNFDCTPKDRLSLTDGRRVREVSTSGPFVYMVRRGTMAGTLDQGLKQQALEAGVRLHFGETRPEKEMDIVTTGPRAKQVFASAMGMTFETSMEDTMVVLFNEKAAYQGYSYVGVRDGNGCIFSVVFGNARMLKGCFVETKRLFGELLDLDMQNPTQMSGVGSFSASPRFREGSTLYAGEAAGLQDLLFGFGIRSAFQSGALAADCLMNGSDYESAASKRFCNTLKAGLVNRFLWEKIGSLRGMDAYHIRGAELFLHHPKWIYRYRLWHRILRPLASRHFLEKYGGKKAA